MPTESYQVPGLSLIFRNFNPNHKHRLLVWIPPCQRWLANLAFAKNDESIYLSPQLNKTYTLTAVNSQGEHFETSADASNELHFSFHETGIVNLTIAQRRIQLRSPQREGLFGRVLALGINNPTGLKPAADAEVNTMRSRYSVIPVTGFLNLRPVYLSVFRVPLNEEWQMPALSDTFQTRFECQLRDKAVKYEFVVWQNARVEPWPGDVAIWL